MRANSECTKCGCRWHLGSREHDVTCDRKVGHKVCGGLVVRDETREILDGLSRNHVTYNQWTPR